MPLLRTDEEAAGSNVNGQHQQLAPPGLQQRVHHLHAPLVHGDEKVRRLPVDGLHEHGRVALLGHRPHELPHVRHLPFCDREPQNVRELRAAAGLAACAPDRAPCGVVQAPRAAVEPGEPGQLAEAETGCEHALAQEHPPHFVPHFRIYFDTNEVRNSTLLVASSCSSIAL